MSPDVIRTQARRALAGQAEIDPLALAERLRVPPAEVVAALDADPALTRCPGPEGARHWWWKLHGIGRVRVPALLARVRPSTPAPDAADLQRDPDAEPLPEAG